MVQLWQTAYLHAIAVLDANFHSLLHYMITIHQHY